jgi:PAS domain S-box-containing protein
MNHMGNILAFKLDPELEKKVKNIPQSPKLINVLSEQKYKEIISKLEIDEKKVDVVIFGTNVSDPISLAQRLHFIDKNISVIIVTSKNEYHKMLDALQFTPFLGEEVSCLSIDKTQDIEEKVNAAILNTRKRKEYQESVAYLNVQLASQNSLQQHSARYIDRLLDFAPVGVILLDDKHKILAWNKKAGELFNKQEREVIGTSLISFFSPNEVNKLQELLTARTQNQNSKKYTFLRTNHNKEVQYLEITVTHLDDNHNNSLIIFEDVTERKIVIQALEESEENFRTSFEETAVGIAHTSLDGKWLKVNKSLCAMLGYSKEELLGLTFQDITHPEDMQISMDANIRLKKGEITSCSFEKRYIKKDKSLLWAHLSISVVHDSKGQSKHFITVIEDITGRKEVEEALIESEDKFRTLAENIPNLAWMANPDGYIFWYNNKWYEYTGTTPADMEGWKWQSVHHPETLPIVMEQWKKSIETGEPFNMVFPIKGTDGKFRPFLTRVNPVHDKKGKVIRWFGTNTDISEQKELEKQKDEFLGVASHELKTPVTSIKAYCQVLQTIFEREGNTKAVKQLAKMDSQIDKLTTLISDLLDVTKIHSGRLTMNKEYFDFNTMLEATVEELQLTTERHKIVKEFDKTVKIYGDRERIGQVVTNLVSNAIKYSPHTQNIIIKTELRKDSLIVCVQDFGVGIPKNKQERVFEQFFRVSGDKQHTFPGLGLGLFISNEIIQRLGGRMWVESIEGKGSTFCFTLPLKKIKQRKHTSSLDDVTIQHE